jgi:hypothetical protein
VALTETTWTPAQEADVFLVDFSFSFHIGFHGIFDATCSPSFDLSKVTERATTEVFSLEA